MMRYNKNWPFILTFACLALYTSISYGQFTLSNDFKGNTLGDIIIGGPGGASGTAYLTSGVDDPLNAGWLRLTNDGRNQRGYAYINKTFPSSLGVIIDFEYTMWRSRNDTYVTGGDGLSIFLFDASVPFSIGAYGGSLGYSSNTATTPNSYGLNGGYIGVGLDAYGNYMTTAGGKVGTMIDPNPNGNEAIPNAIGIRGQQTNNFLTSTPFLAGVVLGNRSGNDDAIRMRNEIDYNTLTSTRPAASTFYRRVQIEVSPSNGDYLITVRWRKEGDTSFTDLISYTTSTPPPPLLKLGFAASSGGAVNNHEIRNLLATTPGNLRTNKLANKNILRSIPAGNAANEITYTIEITNDTPATLSTIDVADKLTDGNGNNLPNGMFHITEISTSASFLNVSLPSPSSASPITNGTFSGSVGLAANTTGIITVKGFLNNQIPEGNLLQNEVTVNSSDISDTDLENNTARVRTPVYAEGVDLIIEKTADKACLDPSNGNNFSLRVSNVGINDLNYSSTNRISVNEYLPSGASISNINAPGWSFNSTTNRFTLTGNGVLMTGTSLPPIQFTINNVNTSYTNEADVSLTSSAGTSAENIEPPNNQNNNTATFEITEKPPMPSVISPVYYCQGDTASPLSATTTAAANTLLWYLVALQQTPLPQTPIP